MSDINISRAEKIHSLLKKINMNVRHVMMKEFNDSKLTVHQFFILKTIRDNPKTNLTSLSSNMKLAKSSLSIMINKLVEDGYVLRKENPKDRRNIYFALSLKGENLLKEARQKSIIIFDKLVSELTEEEIIEVETNLSKLANSIEKIAKRNY